MSEEKTELQIIAEKKEAWSNFGAAVHSHEMQMQAMKQQALTGYKVPESYDEVESAKAKLAELKKAVQNISRYRIDKISSKLDVLNKRLMESESSLSVTVNELNQKIIDLTKKEIERQQKEKQKKDEAASIKQMAIKCAADYEASFKQKIATQILKAYEWALTNDIHPEKIAEYISKCSDKFKITDFAAQRPTVPTWVTHHTTDEASWLIEDSFLIDPNALIDEYRTKLKDKFVFYAVDFKNAEQALEKAAEDHSEEIRDAEKEVQVKQTAAALESLAVEVLVPISSLKQKWQVDRVNTSELELVKAFIANANALLPYIKAKTFYETLAKAIEQHKNKDDGFAPGQVVFTKIEKL